MHCSAQQAYFNHNLYRQHREVRLVFSVFEKMGLRDSRDIEHTNLPFQNLLRRIPELNEEFIGWKYLFSVLYI